MEPLGLTAPPRAEPRSSSADRSTLALVLSGAGGVATYAVVFVAPLLVGSVHRPALLLVPAVAGLGALLVLLAELARGRMVRATPALLLPLSLLVIPALQSLPLPAGLMRKIDPAADALLADSTAGQSTFRPLSLDPPETRAIIGKAGAALAVYLVAFHLASGRPRKRQHLMRVVAASTAVAMAIGLGHRLLGENLIYGHFTRSMGLLNGPFINRNHTAELMALGGFTAVACALAGASALNRLGWLAAALVAGACALGTLSRGAVLSLAVGTIVFVCLRQGALPENPESGARSPRAMMWVTLMLVLLAALAVGLGAEQIVTRVRDTQVGHEMRLALWRDSLRVLLAHPFGIGRGAFERVFPVYRTVYAGIDLRFSFIENEPLQFLVEMGWAGFLVLVATLTILAREWWTARRRDPIEAALAAAVVAVLAHNVVDFGLETLGIQLPFAAILGTLLGRTRDVPDRQLSPTLAVGAWAVAVAAILVGIASVARASSDDFDRLVEHPPSNAAKREIALRAQAAHPTDYLYVLAQAATEPIAPDASGHSPRLHALNRALLLCPQCPSVHSSVAGTLWALGRRPQALTEWHAAVEMGPPITFNAILPGLWTAGGRAHDVATIAGDNPERLMKAASFLISRGDFAGAREMLPLASVAGAPQGQVLLVQASLDIQAGATEQALKSLATARKLLPQDPSVYLLLYQAHVRDKQMDQALADLDTGIGMNPQNLSLLRARLNLVMTERKWLLAKGALEALEIGLAEARLPTTEAHLAAARYYANLSEYGKASSEYDLVLTQDPGNGTAWSELGALWEGAGRLAPALEAYRQANSATPGNPSITAAIERITTRMRALESGATVFQ